jgi:hypothetical protein
VPRIQPAAPVEVPKGGSKGTNHKKMNERDSDVLRVPRRTSSNTQYKQWTISVAMRKINHELSTLQRHGLLMGDNW